MRSLNTGNENLDFRQIHFNVPTSTQYGAAQFPSPDDQYAVIYSTLQGYFVNPSSSGNDWSVFRVYPNPNTGLLPFQVSNSSFFRVARDEIPTSSGSSKSGKKTGFGIDVFPASTCGLNSSSRTQQTTPASNVWSNGNELRWSGVNDGGDSGSPVYITENSVEISAGTNTNCGNSGTSFYHTSFANALDNIFGTTVEHVDNQHPTTSGDGTIIRPYTSLVDGISGASNYETLSIAKGSYDETMTITKPLTLVAPVGSVIIGASGSSKIIGNPISNLDENSDPDKPTSVELSQNYPNPFNPTTTINYQVPDAAEVSLRIYNSLGREVAVLVSETTQPGSYSVNFDASTLASGVYFYVLRTGSKELVKQMTLIK